MRAVIQRVERASVRVEQTIVGEIKDQGVMILLGVETNDSSDDVEWLCGKIAKMRIFGDHTGAMNLSITEVGGSALIVSQFTLHASTRKGNRPSFITAARPEIAIPLYELFISTLSTLIGRQAATGQFGAHMQIDMVADGPVTIIIDSKTRE